MKTIWRVTYDTSVRRKTHHFKDRGMAVRVGDKYRALGWNPLVERIPLAKARLDYSFDPWAEPFKLDAPGPLRRNRAYRRLVERYRKGLPL